MSLIDKLEKAREELDISVQTQESLVVEELLDNVEHPEILEDTKQQMLKPDSDNIQEVIQIYQLTQDFEFIRETLRETQQNGRRMLRDLTSDFMDTQEPEDKLELADVYGKLSGSIVECIKQYNMTYKIITDSLKNLQTVKQKQGTESPKTVKGKTIETEAISTQDIIQRLQKS